MDRTLEINKCEKCNEETTSPLIEVDKNDFDVRYWNGKQWIKSEHKIVVRKVCIGCVRG